VQTQQAVETQQERLEDAESGLQTGRREPITMLPAMPAMPVVAALPALGDLDSKASPESLELVEKISRAAPPEKTAELVQKTLAGETTRRDLREVWRDYRPAVAGSARGRRPRGQDKTPPTAADGEPLHVVAADIVQALRADRGSFIDGRLTSQQWRVHTEVAVRPGTTRQARRIDAVCTEMATSEQRHPGFHAVEIKVRRADLASDHKLTEYADFADTLWLAVPAELAGEAHQLVPEWVGVLAYEASAPAAGMLPVGRRLRVVQPAGAIPRKADLRSELAFELLEKISRAAPPERTRELVNGTLAGETKREELRQAWLDYRPAVTGNARGRRRQGLSQAFAGQVEALEVLRAEIVQALRASRGGFLDGRSASHQWRVQTDITLPAGSAQPIRFDAVCIELATPEQPRPGLHGLAIRVQHSELPGEPELRAAAAYVDTLWLAVPAALSDAAQQLDPAGVGVLAFQAAPPATDAGPPLRLVRPEPPASGLRVMRLAGELSRQADLRGELALALLKRLL
jgi:hypothetical protein